MMKATVKTFDKFPQVTARVEQSAVDGINDASREAALVAQAGASIDLEIEVIPAQMVADGYSGGIKSRKTTRTPGRATPIAVFFDQGTLGERTKPLKRPRKQSWQVKRKGTTYTAKRGPIERGKGIPAERFFTKARAAGKRALLAKIFG
jgi:hypothetical protein